jgi:NAD dependent epimerase/dehydratase family enzyme
LLLASTRVRPARLTDTGYRFRTPDVDAALAHVLGTSRPGH